MFRDNELKYAKEEAKKNEGIEKNKIETTKEMIKDNVDIETISKYTHLSKEKIEKL